MGVQVGGGLIQDDQVWLAKDRQSYWEDPPECTWEILHSVIYVFFNVQQLADLHDYFCIILESYDLRGDLQVLQ